MARVLTDNKNYYDIANTIRQMKNVNTTYKPRQMASALKDIYSNEVEGVPPLTFESNGMDLLDYRIDGASGGVGDRTNNLWNDSITTFPVSKITRTNHSYVIDKIGESAAEIISLPFVLSENKTCNLSFDAYADENNTKIIIDGFPDNIYNSAGIIDSQVILTTENKRYSIQLQLLNGNTNLRFYRSSTTTNSKISKIYLSNIQLEEGSTATDYEPYGYKVPVICGGKTTNIYLDSPIEENESISLSDTEVDIPTIDGTNVLTIDTTVQPSNVYIQARKNPDLIALDMSNIKLSGSTFTTLPSLIANADWSNVIDAAGMFNYCSSLTTVPELDLSSATNLTQMFRYCVALTTLGGFKNLGQSYSTSESANYSDYKLDLSSCSSLTHDSLMNVINKLYDIATKGCNTQQLVLGSTNLAKLSAEEISTCTSKGWSVS